MLILNSDEVRRALPMKEAVAAMKSALMALSCGKVQVPNRAHIDIPEHSGTTLVMPAHVMGETESLAVKVASVFNRNSDRNLARVQAAVTVLDPQTGLPIALLEGSTLTGIRTAAASGGATDILARKDATQLAILGAGVQARTHLTAICAVRDIQRVWIYSPNRRNVDAMINDVKADCELISADSAGQAVEHADIICTVTNSSVPVLDDVAVRIGVHINAVGSYQPHVAEIPAETVARSCVFVDHRQSAMDEAGDLIQPIKSGLVSESHVLGEIGQVLNGTIPGRSSDADITLFKSVGNAAEDAVAAQRVVENARKLGLGQTVEL